MVGGVNGGVQWAGFWLIYDVYEGGDLWWC
jgi:hypothetical protein